MNNFRPVEFWKSSIMTLPDNAFFELLRTVFGKIKTPYNKQLLMGDLEKFLLRDEIKKSINNFINRDDRLIIAAVAALNEPAPGDLEAFFAGELNYTTLQDLIINLEERFILYRFFEEGPNRRISRLALNPVLEPVLAPIAADSSLLFPSIAANEAGALPKEANTLPKQDTSYLDCMRRTEGSETNTLPKQDTSYLDDRILAALLSFVSRNKMFYRAGGSIRQKVSNTAKALFPGLPMEAVMGGLQVLGLFFTEGEALLPDYHRFTAFGGLSRRERMAYCAAGILTFAGSRQDDPEDAFSPWLLRAQIRGYAETISRLYNLMDGERLYPHTTLRKMAYICDNGIIVNNSDKIIEVMKKTGMIVPESTAWRKMPLPEVFGEDFAAASAVIVMDTPNTLLVYPEIAYNDAINIAAFADVIEAGMTVRFELSRDSAVQAFNRGFSADAIIELLKRLSQNRVDENVHFTLRDWEKRHGEVALRRGLVLTLSPEQRHLAETKPLAKLIVETLAPGVYMLPESAEETAAQALSKAGVAIIARRGECRGEEPSSDTLRHFFPSLPDPAPAGAVPPAGRADDGASAASILIDNFRSILEQMRLSSEARDELAARVDRRLVLCEAQLKDANVRYEKLEARGLDYVGKAMIAKQAITMQSPVEIVLPGKQKQDHVFGIPKVLEKVGSESVLVLELLNEGGDTIRIPLGKISLLRRIKKSIFEG